MEYYWRRELTEAEDFAALVRFAAGNPAQVDVLLGWQSVSNGPHLQHLPLTADLALTVQTGARNVLSSLVDRALVRHEIGYDADNTEIEWRAADDTPGVRDLVDEIAVTNRLDARQESLRALDDVGFTVTVLQDENLERAILVRRVTSGRFLAREQRGLWVRATQQNGAFEELDEDLLYLDNDYSCLVFNDTVFVLRAFQFEHLFDFEHHKERFSEEALTEIVEHLPFDDPDGLVSNLRGYGQLRRRLATALDLRLFETVGVEQLEQFASDRGLPVAFADDAERGRVIVVDTSPQARRALVNLLTDSILASGLTEREYVVSGKQPLTT